MGGAGRREGLRIGDGEMGWDFRSLRCWGGRWGVKFSIFEEMGVEDEKRIGVKQWFDIQSALTCYDFKQAMCGF